MKPLLLKGSELLRSLLASPRPAGSSSLLFVGVLGAGFLYPWGVSKWLFWVVLVVSIRTFLCFSSDLSPVDFGCAQKDSQLQALCFSFGI